MNAVIWIVMAAEEQISTEAMWDTGYGSGFDKVANVVGDASFLF